MKDMTIVDLQTVSVQTIMGYEDAVRAAGATSGQRALAQQYGEYVRWTMDAEAELQKPYGNRNKATHNLLQDMGYFRGKAEAYKKEAYRRGYKMPKFLQDAGVE